MNTVAMSLLSMNVGTAAAVRHSRAADALLSLMSFYEQGEGLEEGEESETELMVLLSGMVAVDIGALQGE
ncbi:MAG: hypothetical protein HY067_17555 [Betaproteobacteria bacterium]|nr:hypothetical protein [Betaproteobacteria bacterium]